MNNLFNGFAPMMPFPQPSAQRMPNNNVQKSNINPTQFQQAVPSLSTEILVQLVQQARAQGISDTDIENGLNFINQLRNQG